MVGPQATSTRPWVLVDLKDGILERGPFTMSAGDVLRARHESPSWATLVNTPSLRVVEDLTSPKYGYVRLLIYVKVL